MIQLKRKEAIKLIQYHYLVNLSVEDKGNTIYPYNMKVFNDKKNNWDMEEIVKYKNNKYILNQYNYSNLVTNVYIETLFSILYKVSMKLIDNVSNGIKGEYCPCCSYLVFETKEMFDICPVCMWEITNTQENEYSPPNHLTLKKYRESFFKKYIEDKENLIYKKYLKKDNIPD